MNLSIHDLEVEIKQIGKLRNIHKDPRFLEFIARKCIKVLEEVTESKISMFKFGEIPVSYERGHKYSSEISGETSRINLYNIAVNQFGEYISLYIEYGTGVYSAESARPDGWIYPTTEYDKNPTKRRTQRGDLVAFTEGQEGKYIYDDALMLINDRIDMWVEEYISREVKL